MVAKPLINLHVTPNGCGIFGCDYDKQNSYPDEYYNYDDFNTRRHQQQRPPSKKNNFFSSSNKPKRHYQPDDFFKPSHQYPDYPESVSQDRNRNRYPPQKSQYHDRYGYQQQNDQYDLPQYNPSKQNIHKSNNNYQNRPSSSHSFNAFQESNKPALDAHRFSSSGNNGFVGNANKNVKFGTSTQDSQPVTQVIRHEHYHFHENSNSNKYPNRAQNRGVVAQLTPAHEGISFGYNDYPGFLNDEPRFRSTVLDIDDKEEITSESDKSSLGLEPINSSKNPIGPKQKEKSSFSFPKTQKSLNRSKRDDHPTHSPLPKPSENIEAVGNNNSNSVSFAFPSNLNPTHLACLECILVVVASHLV